MMLHITPCGGKTYLSTAALVTLLNIVSLGSCQRNKAMNMPKSSGG